MENETSKEPKVKVSYCGIEIPDFPLPENLSSFKEQLIEQFGLINQIKPSEISSIKYKDDLINDEPSYNKMIKNISKKGKDIIYITTEKVPIHIEGEKPIEFEDKIKKVVESEFKVAAHHIKEGLINHLSLSNCKKIRMEECSKCNKQIVGYLFKKVSCDKEENYCELCSTTITEPMFKIY